MSNEKEFVTYDQAVSMLPDGDDIHTFKNSGLALLGADWRRSQVLDFFREHEGEIELSGATATAMGHGLAHEQSRLFFATKKGGGE